MQYSKNPNKECTNAVNEMMGTHFPGRPSNGYLLSENLKNKYTSSRKLAVIIRVFTLLSVLIAGFGLYAYPFISHNSG